MAKLFLAPRFVGEDRRPQFHNTRVVRLAERPEPYVYRLREHRVLIWTHRDSLPSSR